MIRLSTVTLALVFGSEIEQSTDRLYELAQTDRPAFARTLAGGAESDAAKATAIVDWLGRNFEWTATDYEKRTVEQIIERRGGNCAELAVVSQALFDDLGIRERRVREINHHIESDQRQRTAAAMVADRGLDRSVFGRRHNDHVWLEVYDDTTGAWMPVDPSLGVAGVDAWLRARAWFGDRTTLDPSSLDMLFPMAIFVLDDERELVENRTRHYMVDALDALYDGALSVLPSWSEWVEALERIDDECLAAFQGRGNLHDHESEIAEIGRIYERLREEYSSRRPPEP